MYTIHTFLFLAERAAALTKVKSPSYLRSYMLDMTTTGYFTIMSCNMTSTKPVAASIVLVTISLGAIYMSHGIGRTSE